jgi:hypothetical protein
VGSLESVSKAKSGLKTTKVGTVAPPRHVLRSEHYSAVPNNAKVKRLYKEAGINPGMLKLSSLLLRRLDPSIEA